MSQNICGNLNNFLALLAGEIPTLLRFEDIRVEQKEIKDFEDGDIPNASRLRSAFLRMAFRVESSSVGTGPSSTIHFA
jgi:hypothetical protein